MNKHNIYSAKTNTADTSNLTWRDKRYQKFYSVADLLTDELQEHNWLATGKLKRRLKGNDLIKLRYSVECILRDCIAVVLHRRQKGEASIHLGQHHYGANRPDKLLTYKITKERAFAGLIELGYINVTRKGYHDKIGRKDGTSTSMLTRFVAKDKLLDLFTDEENRVFPAIVPQYVDPEPIKITVKEKDSKGVFRKHSLPVPINEVTHQMISNIAMINRALAKHWYDLEIPDNELSQLQKRLAGDFENPRLVRFDQRSVHRVFNDAECITGGRFYGGWWQNIPKEYQRHLIINRKPIIELDYSNQHPTILYASENAVRPDDCYSGIIQAKTFPRGKTSKDLRNMIKQSFNAMLNAKKVLRNAPGGAKPSDFGLKWKEVSEAIVKFHAPIAHHFYTGVGLKLQRIDSDIAEMVMLHFVKNGIAILPLHDSFIMHHGYENELREQMDEAFKSVTGYSAKIDKKQPLLLPSDDYEDLSSNDDDLEELLKLFDVGHELRMEAFEKILLK